MQSAYNSMSGLVVQFDMAIEILLCMPGFFIDRSLSIYQIYIVTEYIPLWSLYYYYSLASAALLKLLLLFGFSYYYRLKA